MKSTDIPLPDSWPKQAKSAILNVISMAHTAITYSRAWCADSPIRRVQLSGQVDRLKQEVAMLHEQIRIKDARWQRIPPHNRPQYAPTERLAILELRAAKGWNLAQTARAFLVEPATISAWMRRLDEDGPKALIQTPQPVNKFPAFVGHVVRRLKTICPTMGKKRIAQQLAQAGIAIGTTSVGRFLKAAPTTDPEPTTPPLAAEEPDDKPNRTVTAKYPNHVMHVDLTVVPTCAGFWIPWLPLAVLQFWPFCWWVLAVVDHYSRCAVGLKLFRQPPNAQAVTDALDSLIKAIGQTPKYIVTDKGCQFWCAAFKQWCRGKVIKPRFGAVGRYGSIAIVERFIRSLKDDCTRKILPPFRDSDMQQELDYFGNWFNEYRTH